MRWSAHCDEVFVTLCFRYFKIYKWFKAERSYSHEIGIEQAACDTINNETIEEQQEGNGKSQL